MVRKNELYSEAVILRKRGFSYTEIAKLLNLPKSTLSTWFSRETWSHAIREQNTERMYKANSKRILMLNTIRNTQLRKKYIETEYQAYTEYKHYKQNPLFISGLTLYLTSGDIKNISRLRVSSTVPVVHRLFIDFCCEFLGVTRENIKFWIVTPNCNVSHETLVTWSDTLLIPINQFYKSQKISTRDEVSTLRRPFGNTIINNTVMHKKMIVWIELFTKSKVCGHG